MKVTKNMKNYVEKQVNEKLSAKIAPINESLESRKNSCMKEIEALYKGMEEKAEEILTKYNFDLIGAYDKPVVASIGRINSYELRDRAALEEIVKLRRKRDEMMENFYLECDLGVNKEEFFKMVEAMQF